MSEPRHAAPDPRVSDPRGSDPKSPSDDPKLAVALDYDGGEGAPKVVASGRGAVAEQILRVAFAEGVKVREDADLAELLSAVDVDQEIPLEAFAAVAEILAYVYRANGRSIEDGAPVAPRQDGHKTQRPMERHALWGEDARLRTSDQARAAVSRDLDMADPGTADEASIDRGRSTQ